MTEKKQIVRVSPGALYREVQGEAVILHLDSGEYFGLDSIANRAWQLVVEKGDLAQVEAAMVEEFDVDEGTLSIDLAQFVEELVTKRLVDINEEFLAP